MHFISFSCLIGLAETSDFISNRRRNGGHANHIADFIGNAFSFSTFNIMLTLDLLYIPLLY